MPSFVLHTFQTLRQVKRAPGFQGGSLLPDRNWTFWTMTVWDTPESMRGYMTSGSHRAAMPRLLDWCDEASVAHLEQPDGRQPSWPEAEQRMREIGRASKVRHPSATHANLGFRPARVTRAAPIKAIGT